MEQWKEYNLKRMASNGVRHSKLLIDKERLKKENSKQLEMIKIMEHEIMILKNKIDVLKESSHIPIDTLDRLDFLEERMTVDLKMEYDEIFGADN